MKLREMLCRRGKKGFSRVRTRMPSSPATYSAFDCRNYLAGKSGGSIAKFHENGIWGFAILAKFKVFEIIYFYFSNFVMVKSITNSTLYISFY